MGPRKHHSPRRAARKRLSTDEYLDGIRRGDRATLGRAITLVESNHPAHRRQAQELLGLLLPFTGGARRVGVTGVPGVGKSTFIEHLGSMLTAQKHRVAVLAIDPTSRLTGGSILGDKTRMAKLANDERAFIRPSPSGGALGGVARKTRETMLVCEAAGFDVVLVETVGVGQSESVVADMVDFFLVLMLAGAGDELQGIKRGIIEMADLIAINKCDGDNVARAEQARREYTRALHLMRPREGAWTPRVVTCSGQYEQGLAELWEQIEKHRRVLEQAGELKEKRCRQLIDWMWSMVDDRLASDVRHHPKVAKTAPALERQVLTGATTPTLAAEKILEAFGITV